VASAFPSASTFFGLGDKYAFASFGQLTPQSRDLAEVGVC
jgi:hypothetical protein